MVHMTLIGLLNNGQGYSFCTNRFLTYYRLSKLLLTRMHSLATAAVDTLQTTDRQTNIMA